jgi:hypothetical protein
MKLHRTRVRRRKKKKHGIPELERKIHCVK